MLVARSWIDVTITQSAATVVSCGLLCVVPETPVVSTAGVESTGVVVSTPR
jgi:hypothetical protein